MQVDDIPNLIAESITGEELTPETMVVCIHRGRGEKKSIKYDGIDYKVPAGLFKCQYRHALCFQRRLVVEGSRNLEGYTQQSYIGIICILGNTKHLIDDPALCEAFTDEELMSYGEKLEALDRGDEAISYKSTQKTRAGLGLGPQAEGRTAYVGRDQVPLAAVLTPPEGGAAATIDTAQARAEGALEPQGGASNQVKGRSGGSMADVKNKIKGT